MNQNPVYLIPYDFTPVAESALRLGLDLAKSNNGSVILLNVAKNNSERIEANLKFEKVMNSLSADERDLTVTRTTIGDIFEHINVAGQVLNADLIVMGTHGAVGMQKIFGSNAVKIISSSTNPFLITQGKKAVEKIETIVMPFSYDKKSIIIATFAAKMAKQFHAKLHLVGYHDSDEGHESGAKINSIVVEKYLTERGVQYTMAGIDRKENFDKSLIKYAADNNADLIAAGYYNEGFFTNPKSFIQLMIENELHLPLLTVNAEGLTVGDAHSAATGY